jgi:hypothetical protein
MKMNLHTTFVAVAALALASVTGTASAFAAAQKGQSTQVSREQALRDCNNAAAAFDDKTWESSKSATYATCMTQHGQQP